MAWRVLLIGIFVLGAVVVRVFTTDHELATGLALSAGSIAIASGLMPRTKKGKDDE